MRMACSPCLHPMSDTWLTSGVTSTGSVMVISGFSAGLLGAGFPEGPEGLLRPSFPDEPELPEPLPPPLPPPRLTPPEEPQGDPGLAARTAVKTPRKSDDDDAKDFRIAMQAAADARK